MNNVTGKIYVGSSTNIQSRLRTHLTQLKRNDHQNWKIKREVNKHGLESFSFMLLEAVEAFEHLLDREQFWIDKLEAVDRGYNVLRTAALLLEKARQLMSIKSAKRVVSAETRAKISAANLGRKLSEEARANMSAERKTRPPLSIEARKKIGLAHKNKIVTLEARKRMSEAQFRFHRKSKLPNTD